MIHETIHTIVRAFLMSSEAARTDGLSFLVRRKRGDLTFRPVIWHLAPPSPRFQLGGVLSDLTVTYAASEPVNLREGCEFQFEGKPMYIVRSYPVTLARGDAFSVYQNLVLT